MKEDFKKRMEEAMDIEWREVQRPQGKVGLTGSKHSSRSEELERSEWEWLEQK